MHLQEYANKYVNIMQQISELKALKRVNKTMFRIQKLPQPFILCVMDWAGYFSFTLHKKFSI